MLSRRCGGPRQAQFRRQAAGAHRLLRRPLPSQLEAELRGFEEVLSSNSGGLPPPGVRRPLQHAGDIQALRRSRAALHPHAARVLLLALLQGLMLRGPPPPRRPPTCSAAAPSGLGRAPS